MENNQININENSIIKIVDALDDSNKINITEFSKKVSNKLKNKIKSNGKLVINIDINDTYDINSAMKNLVSIYEYCKKENISIGEKDAEKTVIAYIKDSSNEKIDQIKEIFYVLSMNDLKERYTYIYDSACDYFDKIFAARNFCDFKNDSCSCQRNARVNHDKMGCCYAFYYRYDGIPVHTGECEHLTPTGCNVKCLGCKIFTCRYLKQNGIKFKADDNFLLNIFLNKKQKKYTEYTYFKTEDEILKYWLDTTKLKF